MVHSQGISPSNLFIHFHQRGNLTHDLIHLCGVWNAGCPAWHLLRIWATDKYQEPELSEHCETDKRSSSGRRRRRWVADAKPGNLSFNLQPYIGHFEDRHILFAHDPRVSKNISDFENSVTGEIFSCGCSTCTDLLKKSDRPDGPIRLPKSGECSQLIRPCCHRAQWRGPLCADCNGLRGELSWKQISLFQRPLRGRRKLASHRLSCSLVLLGVLHEG